MYKYIPNIISISRMFVSLSLLLCTSFSTAFYIIYIGSGVSDIIDGYLARKWKVESELGSLLDSIADTIFIFVMLYMYIFVIPMRDNIFFIAIIVLAIKLLSIMVGYLKYHTYASLHTYANKVTGFLLFLLPLVTSFDILIILLCVVTIYAAIEELIIVIKSKTLFRDSKGFWDP